MKTLKDENEMCRSHQLITQKGSKKKKKRKDLTRNEM